MITTEFSPDVWVAIAGALYTIGYLIINQVMLRLVMMVGSFCYIAYYATVGDAPLWGAIYGSILMIGTNIIGLCALYLRNANMFMPKSAEDLYSLFTPIRPGDFRSLMRLGQRQVLFKETIISREGEPIEKLYFIISGTAQVLKRQSAFPMPGPVFVGEVAYLLEANSAATTIVPAGTEMVVWDVAKLRRAIQRKPRLKLALDAVISKDLAMKVSYSVAPADMGGMHANLKAPTITSAPLQQSA